MSIIYTTPKAFRPNAGIHFLHPSERVPRSELDRLDRTYRAKREAEYARSWSDDATLIGSIIYNTDSASAANRSSSDRASIRRRARQNSSSNGMARHLRKLKRMFINRLDSSTSQLRTSTWQP